MKLISIDVHASKKSNLYDGRLRALTVPELRDYLSALPDYPQPVTVVVNAPLTGYVEEFEDIAPFSPSLVRGIEYFFRYRGYGYSTTHVSGVRVTGFAKLAYGSLLQNLFHLNLSRNTHGNRFVPVFDRDRISGAHVNLLETQSDIALWMLTGRNAAWDLATKKSAFPDFRDAFCARPPLPLPDGLRADLAGTEDLHQFNCLLSYALAGLWLTGSEGVRVLGNRYTGSFLLPIDDSLLASYSFFTQRTFINKLKDRSEVSSKRAYRTIARKLQADNARRNEILRARSARGGGLCQVTHHAILRGRERMRLNKRALTRMVDTVYNSGISIRQARGTLKSYLQSKLRKDGSNNEVRVYGEYIYIFNERQLLTLYRLPNRYMKYLVLSRGS
ncbi:hypothetical protein [Lewinella sp. IMCC34183]|uniref:hypothetical protein n=1 Tax=Lewinella sp. IMCC34183 TaxID=2248762 RepID=UPI001300238F|nr:hypothetical protein [Lewinella sp. IMCC34183]